MWKGTLRVKIKDSGNQSQIDIAVANKGLLIENTIISFLINQESLDEFPLQSWQRELSSITAELGLSAEYLVILPESSKDKALITQGSYLSNPTQVVFYNGKSGWDEDMLQLLTYANGDYVYLVAGSLKSQREKLISLYKSYLGSDIAVLEIPKISSDKSLINKILLKSICNNFSIEKPDNISKNMLMSRNSINWIVRDIEFLKSYYELFFYKNLSYETIPYGSVGELSDIGNDLYCSPQENRGYLILNYSNIPRNVLKITWLSNFIFFTIFTLNAVTVKVSQHDIFGTQQVQVKGWPTLVVLISFGFLTISTLLYVGLSAYIGELKKKRKNSNRSSRKIYRL
jgi:hypothetical protein